MPLHNILSRDTGAGKKMVFFMCLLMVPFSLGGIMSVNPATDEEELIFIPPEKERNMGRSIDEKIKKKFDLPVDPLMQERVENIGERIASQSDRRDMVYRFTVLKDEKEDNYNAFAVPGGYIYIFSDLVEALEKDDDLAGVLAHEMGHIEAKHSVKRLQGSLGVTALMLLGTQIKAERGTYVELGKAINELMAAYSRHDEQQADELALRYLELAGFDKNGAIGSLEVLKELRKKAPRMRYAVYKSHPYVSERIAHLKSIVGGRTDFDSYINIVSDDDEL